jgi:hypothetical protein
MTIAALYCEEQGIYSEIDGIDLWGISRDARKYDGPYKVIAHPPCQRWGRFWHGSTRKPHQYKLGDDGGCFAAALEAVRRWGGVLEHPAYSKAWEFFGLRKPPISGGWVSGPYGYTCHVEQGHYGHISRKATWLLASEVNLPDLIWGPSPQRIHPRALELHGYEKARRIGMMAMIGGKDKTKIRNTTPIEFRDLLISIVAVERQNDPC